VLLLCSPGRRLVIADKASLAKQKSLGVTWQESDDNGNYDVTIRKAPKMRRLHRVVAVLDGVQIGVAFLLDERRQTRYMKLCGDLN
jgi:hypothetical protein